MPDEGQLEDMLAKDLGILDPRLLLIGRQVVTDHGKRIDLLAMNQDGHLVVIELKKDRTPRDVIAQVLDYGSWVCKLRDENIATIFDQSSKDSLNASFRKKFGRKIPEELNESHQLLIVASDLDPTTERIVDYLSDFYSANINVAFFRFFRDGDSQYLGRVWLLDPEEVETKAAEKPEANLWNGEYYVSYDEDPHCKWDYAKKYGYINGGGGYRYTNMLRRLEVGDRIWVNSPGKGYVGVGTIKVKAVSIRDFTVPDGKGGDTLITEVLRVAPTPEEVSEEELHYFAGVEWSKAVPLSEAVWQKGFFGNQNIVARPRNTKWKQTVESLKALWGMED